MFNIYQTKNKKIRLGSQDGDCGYVFEDLPGYDMYVGAGVGDISCCDNEFDVIKHFDIPNYMFFDGTIDMPTDDPRYVQKNIMKVRQRSRDAAVGMK